MIRAVTPTEPPVLTPRAARRLLRVLERAASGDHRRDCTPDANPAMTAAAILLPSLQPANRDDAKSPGHDHTSRGPTDAR